MKLDAFTEVLTKQLGARRDGSALVFPADAEIDVLATLGSDAFTVARVTRVELLADGMLVLHTHRNERVALAVEDVRALRAQSGEPRIRERGAGFGK